jgi:hypothetical protein
MPQNLLLRGAGKIVVNTVPSRHCTVELATLLSAQLIGQNKVIAVLWLTGNGGSVQHFFNLRLFSELQYLAGLPDGDFLNQNPKIML